MADIKHEIWTGFIKFVTSAGTMLVLAVLSVLTLLGNNMYLGKKMSFFQAIGSLMVALFVGFSTSIICYVYEVGKVGNIIVPIATLAADKIMMAIIAFDWSKSIKSALRDWLRSISNKLK